ncbi:MAG: tetratricopeptide repeat protein [Formosimonas sp.]
MKRLIIINTLLALSLNTAYAGLNEGIKAYENEHYATALKELEPLAEQGDATAQYYVGTMYDQSYGVETDKAKAFAWYLKSAEQGKTDAQYNVAMMYAEGESVAQDLNKAIEWYKKAAASGDKTGAAQNNLGLLYVDGFDYKVKEGQTIPVDYMQALYWFNIAANEHQNSNAQVSLGYMHSMGLGTPTDKAKAVHYYRLAAEQNNNIAQYNLGQMYRYGTGVTKNLKTAMNWYKKAADNGNEDAMAAFKKLKGQK